MQRVVVCRRLATESWATSRTSVRCLSTGDKPDDKISRAKQPTNLGIKRVVDQSMFNSEQQELKSLLDAAKKEMKLHVGEDGKPPKEYLDLFNKLAANLKRTDVTSKQQLLESPKSQDFRAFVAKRKINSSKGSRFTADELKLLFFEMKHGKFPEEETEKLKRIAQKYELLTFVEQQ